MYIFVKIKILDSVSSPAPAPPNAKKPQCINGGDFAKTPTNDYKRIDELQAGDYVAVDENRFEPIATFLHRDQTKRARGYRFTLTDGSQLTISDEPLVFLAPGRKAILAKNVVEGQKFYSCKNGQPKEATVVKKNGVDWKVDTVR